MDEFEEKFQTTKRPILSSGFLSWRHVIQVRRTCNLIKYQNRLSRLSFTWGCSGKYNLILKISQKNTVKCPFRLFGLIRMTKEFCFVHCSALKMQFRNIGKGFYISSICSIVFYVILHHSITFQKGNWRKIQIFMKRPQGRRRPIFQN